MTIPYIHNEIIHNTNAAQKILPAILDAYNIKSVLDVGTGLGTWLEIAHKYGINDFVGIDGSWADKKMLKIPLENFIEIDLSKRVNINRKFDLVICLEVAEHLPIDSASLLIETLTEHSEIVLFSAAIPKQGGQNHINEQIPQYWINLFKARGYECYDYLRPYIWNDVDIEWWYRQNIFIYSCKKIAPLFSNKIPPNMYVHPELFYNLTNKLESSTLEIKKILEGNKNPKLYLKLLIKSLLINK
jgi:SAM-dependent methyltransferase